jgi:hypothetical protein
MQRVCSQSTEIELTNLVSLEDECKLIEEMEA